MKSTLLVIAISLLYFSSAQTQIFDSCTTQNFFEFQGNNLYTYFSTKGSKFWDGNRPSLYIPYNGPKNSPAAMCAGALWVAAIDDQDSIRTAIEAFGSRKIDFQPGPLLKGNVFPENFCSDFNTSWTVNRLDVLRHLADFNDNGVIDDPLPSIYGWPATGNEFFESSNDFPLPEENFGWAEYHDLNNNNQYEPDLGEYPAILIAESYQIPEQMMWYVINSAIGNNAASLRMTYQVTAYAFACEDNENLNNTLFMRYKIINHGDTDLRDLRIGDWMDPHIGCGVDDVFGTAPDINTLFTFNMDNRDGDENGHCQNALNSEIYGDVLPAVAVTALTNDLHSTQLLTFADNNPSYPFGTFFPETAMEVYRRMDGRWNDGTAIARDGIGYDPTSIDTTKFIFDGEIKPDDWNMVHSEINGAGIRVLCTNAIPSLPIDSALTLNWMYSFHRDSSLNHIEIVDQMRLNIMDLQEWYFGNGSCIQPTKLCDTDCVWPGDSNVDGVVNGKDFLYVAQHFNKEGLSRITNQSTWQEYYAPNWTGDLSTLPNAKYADANGDGVINHSDLEFLRLYKHRTNRHYQETEANSSVGIGEELKIYGTNLDLNKVLNRVYIEAGEEIDAINGLNFDIVFDTNVIYRTGAHILWNPFPDQLSIADFSSFHESSYRVKPINYSVAAIDHSNYDIPKGFEFQRIYFRTVMDDYDLLPDSTIIQIKNILALDKDGNELNLGTKELVMYKSPSTSTKNIVQPVVEIFPNPAHQKISVHASQPVDKIRLFDLNGRLILETYGALQNDHLLDVSHLPNGIFFLEIKTENNAVREKIIIQH